MNIQALVSKQSGIDSESDNVIMLWLNIIQNEAILIRLRGREIRV